MLAFPNIKINLGLSITEKRPDGYHNLETVFYPVALEDALEIRTSSEAYSLGSRTGGRFIRCRFYAEVAQ